MFINAIFLEYVCTFVRVYVRARVYLCAYTFAYILRLLIIQYTKHARNTINMARATVSFPIAIACCHLYRTINWFHA